MASSTVPSSTSAGAHRWSRMPPATCTSQRVRSGSTIARESRWAFSKFPSGPGAWRLAAQIVERSISERARLSTRSARRHRGADLSFAQMNECEEANRTHRSDFHDLERTTIENYCQVEIGFK